MPVSQFPRSGGSGSGTTDHNALTNRSASGQHPQSAITDLVADLDAITDDIAAEEAARAAGDTAVTALVTAEVTNRTEADTAHVAHADPHTIYQKEAEKGVANGYAPLDASGFVPTENLPAGVDEILEYANLAAFPGTGASAKIYVALDTSLTYRWSGTQYTEISASLALGETSATAYRGDRGKTAYDHTALTNNPHSVTKSQVGLANADNTSDVNKPISTATQTALDAKAATSHAHAGSDITSGTIAAARLGSGTPNTTTYLRGDNTWVVPPGGSTSDDWTNVLDYGAAGDGVANDMSEINAALTAAGIDGVVFFPAGTYLVNPTPGHTAGANLYPYAGQTWLGIPGLSIIQLVDDGSGTGTDAGYGIGDGTAIDGVTFEGLVFDGGIVGASSKNTKSLLDFRNSTNLTIRNCELRNAVGKITTTSVSGRAAMNLADSTDLLVEGCYVHHVGWHPGDDWKDYGNSNGQGIRCPGGTRIRVRNNEIAYTASTGIYTGRSSTPNFLTDAVIENNYIHDVMYGGISNFSTDGAQGSTGVRIRGNHIARTNGYERGTRPGTRTITAINSGNGTSVVNVTLSGPIVDHPNGDKVLVYNPTDGLPRGETYPGNTNNKATTSAQSGAGGSGTQSPWTATATTPTVTLTFTTATTVSTGDIVAPIEQGEPSAGIYNKGGTIASDIVIEDNLIQQTNEPGIELNRHPATARNNTVIDTGAYSWLTASDRNGIFATSGCVVTGNLIVRAWGSGIQIPANDTLPGLSKVICTDNIIVDCNYGSSYGSGGLRTGTGPVHRKNSNTTAGIELMEETGNSITDCIVRDNWISGSTTQPDYATRFKLDSGQTADSTNDFGNNHVLTVPVSGIHRYQVGSTTTPTPAFGVRWITSAVTLTHKDAIVVATTAGYTVTLPAAIKGPEGRLTVRNAATSGNITLDGNGSENIVGSAGAATTLVLTPGQSATLVSDFVDRWYTI